MNRFIGIFFFVLITMTPHQIMAANYDGSAPLICAIIEAFECSVKNDCTESTAEEMNIPQFFRLDFKNKMLRNPEEKNEKKETAIRNIEHDKGALILQGMENGRGWSIVIDEDTGKMSASISENTGGFVIFGACTLD